MLATNHCHKIRRFNLPIFQYREDIDILGKLNQVCQLQENRPYFQITHALVEQDTGHTSFVVLLITQLLRLVGRLDPANRFNDTSWVAVVTQTDQQVGPQSLCNRSFGGVFVLSRCFLFCCFFCGCRGFCHRVESDLFLFLLHSNTSHTEFELLDNLY